MAVLKLHFIWIQASQLDLQASVKTWHPARCLLLTKAFPYTDRQVIPPPFLHTSFDSVSLLPRLLPWLHFLHWWGFTFQTVSFLKTSSDQSKGSRIIGQRSVRPTAESYLPDF